MLWTSIQDASLIVRIVWYCSPKPSCRRNVQNQSAWIKALLVLSLDITWTCMSQSWQYYLHNFIRKLFFYNTIYKNISLWNNIFERIWRIHRTICKANQTTEDGCVSFSKILWIHITKFIFQCSYSNVRVLCFKICIQDSKVHIHFMFSYFQYSHFLQKYS